MAHLTHFGLDNFRVFGEPTLFEFRPITILTGTNSSGKSSLIKAIQLLQNSLVKSENIGIGAYFDDFFKLISADNINIGHFDNWVNRDSPEKEIVFSFPWNFLYNFSDYSLKLTYSKNISQTPSGILNKIAITDNKNGKEVLLINDKSYQIDINELWDRLVDFNTFIDDVKHFIDKIIPKVRDYFPELVVNFLTDIDDNYIDPVNMDFTSEAIYGYLDKRETFQFTGSFDNNKFDVSRIPESLSENEKQKLKNIIATFEKLPISMYPDNTISALFRNWTSGTGNFNLGQPLLIYDIFHEKHLENYDYTLPHNPKDLLLKLQKNDLSCISSYLGSSKMQREKTLPAMCNEFSDMLKMNAINEVLDIRNLSRLGEMKIVNYLRANFEKFDIDSVNLVVSHPSELGDNQDYSNLSFFIDKYLIGSLSKNIESINGLFTHNSFIPSHRNQNPSRNYLPGNKGFFTELLSRLNRCDLTQRIATLNILNELVQLMGITDAVEFVSDDDGGISRINLLDSNGKTMNLADYGHGISQLLPILLSIAFDDKNEEIEWVKLYYKTIIIEEPETNLHPELQSKLADVFVYMYNKFGCRFIIETHSEYLIRKLQYLTGKGEIEPDLTQLYYFNHPNKIPKGEKQIKKINIQKDGSLTDDFGTGFFDEATNWKFELTKLKNSQRN